MRAKDAAARIPSATVPGMTSTNECMILLHQWPLNQVDSGQPEVQAQFGGHQQTGS
jgi:hypothetical protein